MESQHPGFAYDFIKSILKKAEVAHRLDMTESFLRLEGLNTSTGKLLHGLNTGKHTVFIYCHLGICTGQL